MFFLLVNNLKLVCFFLNTNIVCCQNVIISEGQKGICSPPDVILTETEVYGHEELSTTSHISTGAQWYSASNVMEIQLAV